MLNQHRYEVCRDDELIVGGADQVPRGHRRRSDFAAAGPAFHRRVTGERRSHRKLVPQMYPVTL